VTLPIGNEQERSSCWQNGYGYRATIKVEPVTRQLSSLQGHTIGHLMNQLSPIAASMANSEQDWPDAPALTLQRRY
jgi:hypothetical protein